MNEAVSTAEPSPEKNAGEVDSPAETSGIEAERLEQQNRELIRLSRYRSLFLARLAHELRTPLTSILGFSEILLSQEKLTDAQRSFCERIQSSARQLQNSLTQLSDLARLESGQTQLATEEFSLGEVLRESVAAVARRAQKRRVTIDCDVDTNWPALNSDRGRLRQVVYNVLAYGIARTPEKDVLELAAEVNADNVEIIMHDKGERLGSPLEIGMLEAENDKAGTGELGLAIARQNIQILGGTITAANRDDGLEVKVTLPLNPPHQEQ
ncbi:MAG TPA: HAMP domain-containing sensor histidine kinase [Pyrinomonadaceae bacterium]